MQEGHAEKKYSDRNSYRFFNVIACNIHLVDFPSTTHYTLSSCCHRFRGSAITKRRRELTLPIPFGDIVWR